MIGIATLEALIQQLRHQIDDAVSQAHANWSVFERLRERAHTLQELHSVRGDCSVSERDVERVTDASVQFLANWLIAINIEARLKTLNRKDLESRRNEISGRLEEDPGNSSLKRALSDIEAVTLLANNLAQSAGEATIPPATLAQAITDYLPNRDRRMIEFMELQAVLESSRRSMLPRKYRDLDEETLQLQIKQLRLELRL